MSSLRYLKVAFDSSRLNFNRIFSFLDTLNILTTNTTFISKPKTTMADEQIIIERCKSQAAKLAVDENITSDCVVGIGSGSTMAHLLQYLVHYCENKGLSLKFIPTSYQSKQLIQDNGFTVTDLDSCYPIDITIDGADEVDKNFVAIKGGGACLTQEKVVAAAARKFIIIADYRKNSKNLGDYWSRGLPIEVLPMACNSVRYTLIRSFGASLKTVTVRTGNQKAGPVVTDNGNFVLDWKFDYQTMKDATSDDWKSLSDKIKLVPGVIETGIFANLVNKVYFGQPDGTVLVKEF